MKNQDVGAVKASSWRNRLFVGCVLSAASSISAAAGTQSAADNYFQGMFGVYFGAPFPRSIKSRWVEYPGGKGNGVGSFQFKLSGTDAPFVDGVAKQTPNSDQVYAIEGSVKLEAKEKCQAVLEQQKAKVEAVVGGAFVAEPDSKPGWYFAGLKRGPRSVGLACMGSTLTISMGDEPLAVKALAELIGK